MALIVCIGHLGLNTIAGKIGLHIRFELAVDVFFAMSGFVLAQAYYFQRRSFMELFRGRIARLYPLQALTLFWMLGLAWETNQTVDWTLVWQNVFLVQNIGLPPHHWAFNFPGWSISVEMAISLLFYFVARRSSSLFCVFLAAIGVALGSHLPSDNNLGLINSGLLRGLAGFCIGCSSYLLVKFAPSAFRKLAIFAPLLFLTLILFFFATIWTGPIGALAGALFELSLLLFLAISAVNDRGSLLASRPFVFLGGISYSIYMLHIPLYMTLASFVPETEIRQAGKFLVLIGVILAATLCHRYFELPMQQALLRLTTRKQARRSTPSDCQSAASN